MAAWFVTVALLQIAPASSASAFFSRSSSSSSSVEAPTLPMCEKACDDYASGVSRDTEAVCMDASRTCSQSGCGMGLCVQKFNDDCADHCSEWEDATPTTINVCQSKTKTGMYKCSGNAECGKDQSRCKQKKIEQCWIFCEGYGYSGEFQTDQNSDLVCQDTKADSENFGICMPLPCSMTHHTSTNYKEAKVCIQAMPTCKNSCAAGSDAPNATNVCFDEYSEKCENHLTCPDSMTRCLPTKTHQNLNNLPKTKVGWSMAQSGSSKHLTQAEWRAEQQREKVAALKSMTAQRPIKSRSIMRRAVG